MAGVKLDAATIKGFVGTCLIKRFGLYCMKERRSLKMK